MSANSWYKGKSAGRETIHNGVKIRYASEAGYARLLDEGGVAWEYEPRSYSSAAGHYLPDFYLPESNTFVEIKPSTLPEGDLRGAEERMRVIWSSNPTASLTIVLAYFDEQQHEYTEYWSYSKQVPYVPGQLVGSRHLLEGTHGDLTSEVVCPVCKICMAHLMKVETEERPDRGRNAETDAVLHFECENAHAFAVSFTQHKGTTLVEALYEGHASVMTFIDDDVAEVASVTYR